jgi:asparagine synthase (glutamine-hydrolysing)
LVSLFAFLYLVVTIFFVRSVMGAFAVIFERGSTQGEPGVFARVMERLSHRGPDGSNAMSANNILMGHWHFWTTPEEVGERQPLALDGLPFRIVFDGRIDNRKDLFAKLDIASAEEKPVSDAALILRAYASWGESCFERLVGEFALVIFDELRNEVVCARDQLGDRTLFYALYGTQLVIASEPWAVACASPSKPTIHDGAVAHYFAMKATEDGQTLFDNIYELLPAHAMTVSSSARHARCYWQPDPNKKIRFKTDAEYGEQFRVLLEESIRCRLRSAAPVGILMSGGLDSTSVACLAAGMLAPEPLPTISYVFDELTDCDERKYIESVKEEYGIHSVQIPCDDALPFKDWQNWVPNLNQPAENPFRALKERAYQRAKQAGIKVLLTGGFGDQLYSSGSDWFADLISEGQIQKAIRELSYHIRYFSFSRIRNEGFLQRAARRFVNRIPGGKFIHRKASTPKWITPLSRGYLLEGKKKLATTPKHHASMIGIDIAQSCSREIPYVNRHNVELRHPYRDRRLIEFVMGLPGYQLYYLGLRKRILRNAMKGILPEIIRTRETPTHLLALLFRGFEQQKDITENFFQGSNLHWQAYVRTDWLLKRWKEFRLPTRNGRELLVPWLCVAYELWYGSLISLN